MQLKRGQDGARSDDTCQMKKSIIEMLPVLDPDAAAALDLKEKQNRGFNHPLTGRLLCPARLDWANEGCVPYIIFRSHTYYQLTSAAYPNL